MNVSGKKGGTERSPTLDRLIPELGYVPGNIAVISMKANRIKSDTDNPAEMAAVALWQARKLGRIEGMNGTL